MTRSTRYILQQHRRQQQRPRRQQQQQQQQQDPTSVHIRTHTHRSPVTTSPACRQSKSRTVPSANLTLKQGTDTHPNGFPPTGIVISGSASWSAVSMYTVFPHQLSIVSRPIEPDRGYCRLRPRRTHQIRSSPHWERLTRRHAPEKHQQRPDRRPTIERRGQHIYARVQAGPSSQRRVKHPSGTRSDGAG